jgi:diguanylate cyclase (GGDEF)-like protein
MAIDTLASVLRTMGEFALDQERADAATFRRESEEWAQHVTLAAPIPGQPSPAAAPGGRRDWQGVRAFVREYCRSSSKHAASVAGDLREVIWAFIRNFSQTLAANDEVDGRIRDQVARLERLVSERATAELKREVQEVLGSLSQAVEERRRRQREQMASLGQTVEALGSELESARREGERDPLTRVFNRKALDAHLERTVEMFRAFRHDTCLLVVDVDHFKEINDAHGHVVGDQALCQVADAIAKVFLRRSDFVARFGGDEFAVILRETSLAAAAPLAERVLARVRALRIPAGGKELALTASMGAAALTPEDDVRTWFQRADAGLYAAKSAGRDRLEVGRAAEPPGPAAAPAAS